jgi:hypothetical protein
MPKIIISHDYTQYKKRWHPFNAKKDVKKMIEDVWKSDIVGSPFHQLVKGKYPHLFSDKNCDCRYPSNTRPVDGEILNRYHGCIFDVDAYLGKVEYLVKEVESLSVHVYVGGITRKPNNFQSIPNITATLFEKPILDENTIVEYLDGLMPQMIRRDAHESKELMLYLNVNQNVNKTQ